MSGLLRLCTAGSVDDGKSTLIGRLLYESRAVYEDQLSSVRAASRNRGAGPIDFSLFTDGLRAEREQGITIDVAYRYFATARRKFILADTPGHEQYTRNMATGASTADLAILLVDARHGIRDQTRRHARIARLLGITNFVLAVNKMDLVGFDRSVYESIRDGFAGLLDGATLHAIPLSALHGDNVVAPSSETPWFTGAPLLEYLETVSVDRAAADHPFRFPVQLVVRPSHDFRGYAGQIAAGTIRPGDPITVWPSGRATRVKRIVTWDGDLALAHAPMSVTLTLEDEVDISRGDLLATTPPQIGRRVEAQIVWMDERPLDPRRVYLLKHAARVVTAELNSSLALNDIGLVAVTASRPLIFDPYDRNRATGSFVVVDPVTNATAGAGMIVRGLDEGSAAEKGSAAAGRLARAARSAASEAEAEEAVQRLLEEILT
jgi:sulfate adenylyltransferase large subunit